MSLPTRQLMGLFLAGRHGDVVERALLDDNAHFDLEDTPAVVSALALFGQLPDAELLHSHQSAMLSVEDQAFGLYHLLVAATGLGRYEQARRFLGRLVALRALRTTPAALFFVYQGFAHYRYSTGRLLSAQTCVHRAGDFARRSGSRYLLLLWLELRGHLQVLIGQAEDGLLFLQAAIGMAGELERAEQARGLVLASVLYTARYRQGPRDAQAALAAQLSATPRAERIARASLLLELVRQEALRQQLAAAKEHLAKALPLIAGLAGRRYEIVLNARLADVLTLGGDLHAAMIVTQTGLRLLNPEADVVLEVELQARRIGLAAALGLEELGREARDRLAALERRTGFVRPPEPEPPKKVSKSEALNHRQLTFLKDLGAADLVDVHAYRRRFQVSEITACRDLAVLSRAQYLKRIGKARATRYARGPRPAP